MDGKNVTQQERDFILALKHKKKAVAKKDSKTSGLEETKEKSLMPKAVY